VRPQVNRVIAADIKDLFFVVVNFKIKMPFKVTGGERINK
jgi:hypothetical protein